MPKTHPRLLQKCKMEIFATKVKSSLTLSVMFLDIYGWISWFFLWTSLPNYCCSIDLINNFPSGHLFVQSQLWKQQSNKWNMFNKLTIKTPEHVIDVIHMPHFIHYIQRGPIYYCSNRLQEPKYFRGVLKRNCQFLEVRR